MAEYQAEIVWCRNGAVFVDQRYSRRHLWLFDGGAEVPASSSPDVVPLPWSDATAVDPEEAFVASLSSCHMLWFLSLAARHGRMAMTRVTLRPDVRFAGDERPTGDQVAALHDEAHERCYIANSVKTAVQSEPIVTDSGVTR